MTEPLGLSDPHLRALGWLVAAAGNLETVVYMYLRLEAGLRPDIARVLFGYDPFERMVDKLVGVVVLRYPTHPAIPRLRAWATEAKAFGSRRNELVHASWLFSREAEDKLEHTIRAGTSGEILGFKSTSVSELNALAAKAGQLSASLLDMRLPTPPPNPADGLFG